MKILDYYILKKFLKTYVFAVFIIVLIVMVIDYTEKIDDFIRKPAPIREILFDYYLNFIPYWASYISPLMVFIATVFFTAKAPPLRVGPEIRPAARGLLHQADALAPELPTA